MSKLGVTMSRLARASDGVVGDVALGRDERRARLQGLAAAQLDGVPALAVGQHGVDVAPGHQRGGLPRAGAAADGLAPRHVLAQCPRREHAQLLLQRGGVVGVGVDAAAGLGDALQLAPRRCVDVEADRLDAHLDAALGDALGDLARRGRLTGVLAVGDEDDRPRARGPEVLGRALERVGDRGAPLRLERADLLLGLRAVQRADRQHEARVAARGPDRPRGLGPSEHAQPDLGRRRQRAEQVDGGVLRGVDLRRAGAVVGRHGARGVEGEQDLGRPGRRALGRARARRAGQGRTPPPERSRAGDAWLPRRPSSRSDTTPCGQRTQGGGGNRDGRDRDAVLRQLRRAHQRALAVLPCLRRAAGGLPGRRPRAGRRPARARAAPPAPEPAPPPRRPSPSPRRPRSRAARRRAPQRAARRAAARAHRRASIPRPESSPGCSWATWPSPA